MVYELSDFLWEMRKSQVWTVEFKLACGTLPPGVTLQLYIGKFCESQCFLLAQSSLGPVGLILHQELLDFPPPFVTLLDLSS